MPRQELLDLWASVTQNLEAALTEVRALLTAEMTQIGEDAPDSPLVQSERQNDVDLIAVFIDYNELGLALEHMCALIAEANLPIVLQTYADLESAGEKMQMPASIWQSINPAPR